jgi:hypothetical protein
VASFPGGLRDVIFAVVGNHRKQEPAKEKNIPNEGYPRPKLASRTGLLRALTESVMFYSNWSGVGTAYSYFAPKVAEIPRTRFEIVHVSGDISEYILGVQQFAIQLRVAALTRLEQIPADVGHRLNPAWRK